MSKDCRAVLGYDNRFHTRPSKPASFTGSAGTWALPMTNLGRQQLGEFVRFEGASATLECAALDDADLAQTFSADLLGILGIELEAGTLVEFLNGTDLLAAATWRPTFGHPPHLPIVLPDVVTMDTLTIRFSNAGAGGRIGVPWASPSLRFLLDAGWGMTGFDTGALAYSAGGTPHSSRGQIGYTLPIRFRARRVDLSHGLHVLGASVAIPATWTTNNATSSDGNEYTFAAVSGTLLEQTGLFTAGKHYEIEINTTYTTGNAGIPAVEIGAGNQWALQPGRNQIVGTADDGSSLALRFLTATGTAFSGTIEILSIRECSAPKETNAKHVIETAAATEPVLWLPRTGQAWHQVAATYGQLAEGGSVTHRAGPTHDVRMDIRQGM